MKHFALLPLLCAGCGYLGTSVDADPEKLAAEPGWVMVRDVPFVGQEAERDCGAAALSMVLNYWGLPDRREEVVAACGGEEDRIEAGRLVEYARTRGLAAYVFSGGKFADLERELGRGRPVLVGLIKPHADEARSHYEVVVGVHREKQEVVTLDPARGWRQNTYREFLTEWTAPPSDRLTMVFSRR